MTQDCGEGAELDERAGDTVVLTRRQVRLLIAGFEAAGAHDPAACDGECPGPAEHAAVVLLHELGSRGGETR